jgi:ABC-type transporter Mla subunit MlaD
MAFSDRMRDLLDQGAQASKVFLSKAGAKAQNLGERGVLTLELKQLEGQVRKLLQQLGNGVYRRLIEENAESVSASEPEIRNILSELESLRQSIEKREGELESRRKS